MALEDIFGIKDHVSVAQECARAGLIFFYGLLLMRLSGRRTFAKWSALDVAVSVIAGSNLSRALTGGAPLWGTLVATAALMGLHWTAARLASKSPGMARIIEGPPVPLGADGRLEKPVLRRFGLSEEDVGVALRQEGLDDATQARLFMLEPNGRISILKKS
ncbi:DUF421 domain-containing protein [Methylocystis sp. JAN1]|uniref:DUF421 domain-containing protein n=1 Tax=Methylocystis sp. JAN1 TaxID=3397211 RepID=UPI003FA274B9